MKKTAVFAILLAVAVSAHAKEGGTARSITLPVVETPLADGEGKVVVTANCSSCHSLDYIVMQPKLSADAWSGTVNKMRKVFGAEISDADAAVIASYLARNYGTEKKGEAVAATGKDPAPGTGTKFSGESSFKKYCVACHAGGGNIIRPGKPSTGKIAKRTASRPRQISSGCSATPARGCRHSTKNRSPRRKPKRSPST